jgi:4a-hydroxytetrahydrobiopterin dehydratase
MEKLTNDEIQSRMKDIPGWRLENDMIVKDWSFKDFAEAMEFIDKIADLAEAHDHHPEIFNVYNKLTLRFSTHDAGGITERDFKIAREIDDL